VVGDCVVYYESIKLCFVTRVKYETYMSDGVMKDLKDKVEGSTRLEYTG
jgi:hypothetical protein